MYESTWASQYSLTNRKLKMQADYFKNTKIRTFNFTEQTLTFLDLFFQLAFLIPHLFKYWKPVCSVGWTKLDNCQKNETS